jgi:hypothetical protein
MSHHDEQVLKWKIDLIIHKIDLVEARLSGANAEAIRGIIARLKASQAALDAAAAAGATALDPPQSSIS